MNKIFINSIPKGGTNLVAKLVKQLGYSFDQLFILGSGIILQKENWLKKIIRGLMKGAWLPHENIVLVGVEMPTCFRSSWIENLLMSVKNGEVIAGHIRHTDYFHYLLECYDFKILQVIRDPRDITVSHAYYVSKREGHFLYPHYQKLENWEARLEFSITGGFIQGLGYLESIGSRARSVYGWLRSPKVLTVKFEDLVGPNGGGSLESQNATIIRICEFLEVESTPALLENLQESIFGGTWTFRKGKIGSWKEEYSELHRTSFYRVARDVLIDWGYDL